MNRDARDSLVFITSIGAFVWTLCFAILFIWTTAVTKDYSFLSLSYGPLALMCANLWLFLISPRVQRWVEAAP